MGALLEFKDVNFQYNNEKKFDNFNLEIQEGDIVSIIGPSGSGKTTLLKMLCHKLPNESLYYDNKKFADYSPSQLKKTIVVIFDVPLVEKTIESELKSNLVRLHYPDSIISSRYENIVSLFNLEKIANKSISNLSHEEEYLIKILRFLILEPSIIAMDNMLANISKENKIKIVKYIKECNITFLNITNDINETLLGNRIYVLENFELILEGSTLSVLKTDTLLKRLGYKLPLPVDLSIELIHYDLIDKVYTSLEKLVSVLWK